MIDELKKLREITETLTGNGYLKDQAEEWEYALDAIPDCVYIINNKFEIKFSNKVLCSRLGVDKEDLYGRLCYEVIFGCNDKDFFPNWSEDDVLQTPSILKDVFVEKLSGWFDVTRSPIHTKNNKLIGFICVLQDITARRVAGNNLQHREALLEAVFDSTPVGIGLLDRKNRSILAINKFATDMTEYSEYELLRKTDRVLYKSEKTYAEVGKLIDNGGVGSVRGVLLSKSGKELYVDIKVSFIGINDPDRVLFIVNDLTSSVHKDIAIRKLKSELSKFHPAAHM